MAKGKGIISLREVNKILKKKGYEYMRNNGHQIWGNGENTIVVPTSCKRFTIEQQFRKYNIAR